MTPTPPPARCEPPEGLRDEDGWHEISQGNRRAILYWMCPVEGMISAVWSGGILPGSQVWTVKSLTKSGWRYVAPVHTPDEIAALIAAARREGAEEMRERAKGRLINEGLTVFGPIHGPAGIAAVRLACADAIAVLPLPGDTP